MAKIVGKCLGMVGYSTGLGTNSWASDMEANLRKIDAILQAGAIAIQNTPPASPVDGQVYIVGTAPTGAWASQANAIARWNGSAAPSGAWEFFAPAAGWWIAVGSQDYRFSGTAWVAGWTPAHGPTHEYNGADPITGQNLSGLRITDAPRWAGVGIVAPGSAGDFDWRSTDALRKMTARWNTTLDQLEFFSSNDAGGSRSNRIILPRSDSSPVLVGLGLNVASGALQVGGVDSILATREGRFTGLRLSNMAANQIPVSSDANGQITASGLTDDGTFLGASRVLRMWNSMARSGNTWTDLQWTQDVNERVSILSSNSSGQYAYHSWVFVPPDAEATGRVLGGQMWAQKVSGKSGTAPGLKAAMYAKTAGTGGSTGGFGAQIVFNYRPDNGATQVDALKIGAFGGGVADAVQADILLRAAAGIQTDYIRFGSETQSGNWSPTTTTKRYVKQTGAGTITLPVNCSAYAGMEFTVVMTMTSVANVFVEKDTHGTTDRYFFKDAIPSAWTDVYGFANRLIAGRSPTGGAAAGETALVHFMCDGSYWWIHCD